MDILPSALDSRIDPESSHDDPAFSELVTRIINRLAALGMLASREHLQSTVLEVVQDVAHFTLAWAEPEAGAAEPVIDPPVTQEFSADRHW